MRTLGPPHPSGSSHARRLGWCAAGVILAGAGGALAEEPVQATEPRLFREPGEMTDVVDAFDDGDLFDVHLSLGYQYTSKTAKIRREPLPSAAGTLAVAPSDVDVASYDESTSRLNTRADIGLYKDIALVVRMPIILANDRNLTGLGGSIANQGTILAGAPGDTQPLFQLPFRSPQRTGIEYLALGLDFGLMNQMRDPTKPTWVFGLEGRFSVTEPMHACNAGATPVCANSADVNRDGQAQPNASPPEGTSTPLQSPGVSRGTTALDLHTFVSKRIKYIEPYVGLRALFEFANASSDYGTSDLKAAVVNHPPLQGWIYAGLETIPWEQRESFQRVSINGRVGMSYRSEGRDYSELFDALGSSSSLSLRAPNYSTYMAGPQGSSVADTTSRRVYFSGITDVAAHATLQLLGSLSWQAGEYIKFQVGGAWTYTQPHLITVDQACNADFAGNLNTAGSCRSSVATSSGPTMTATGVPNPNYRAAVNQVGRRFRVDDTNIWEAWVNGVVMF